MPARSIFARRGEIELHIKAGARPGAVKSRRIKLAQANFPRTQDLISVFGKKIEPRINLAGNFAAAARFQIKIQGAQFACGMAGSRHFAAFNFALVTKTRAAHKRRAAIERGFGIGLAVIRIEA